MTEPWLDQALMDSAYRSDAVPLRRRQNLEFAATAMYTLTVQYCYVYTVQYREKNKRTDFKF